MEKIYKFNGEEFDNYEEAEDEAIGYANDLFDEHLDDYFGKIKVGFFEYKTSDVLRRVDENLYAVMTTVLKLSKQFLKAVKIFVRTTAKRGNPKKI